MSGRLELIASLALDSRGIADIGTDHAKLPILLRRMGYDGYISASDINDGPLKKAANALSEAEIYDVDVIRSDGLERVDSKSVDTIVVAGMGGDTICGILDRGLFDIPEWADRSDFMLIMHPVTKPEILRYWLINNGMRITEEAYVLDNDVLCQIICAQPGIAERYSDAELFIGKYENVCESRYFNTVLDKHIKRFSKASAGLENAGEELKAWKNLIDGIGAELNNMKRWHDG